MITSLIEMLELPLFGHMTTSTIFFESRDKTGGSYDVITFISKHFYFKKA